MIKLLSYMHLYFGKQDGATAIEYGLIAALISLAIVAGATVFGEQLGALFETMANTLTGSAGEAAEEPA